MHGCFISYQLGYTLFLYYKQSKNLFIDTNHFFYFQPFFSGRPLIITLVYYFVTVLCLLVVYIIPFPYTLQWTHFYFISYWKSVENSACEHTLFSRINLTQSNNISRLSDDHVNALLKILVRRISNLRTSHHRKIKFTLNCMLLGYMFFYSNQQLCDIKYRYLNTGKSQIFPSLTTYWLID